MNKIIIICILFCIIGFALVFGCTEIYTYTIPKGAIFCTAEQKAVTSCDMEYIPVCGSDDVSYTNKCVVCSTKGIEYYLEGEC